MGWNQKRERDIIMTIQQEIVRLTPIEDDNDTIKNKNEIELGLDFILSHLEEPKYFQEL